MECLNYSAEEYGLLVLRLAGRACGVKDIDVTIRHASGR
jgi:hypothetical protein